MPEYIERETAVAWFMPYAHAEESIDADVVISDIKGMKAADVATVRHGRWIEHEETQEDAYRHHKCSECNVNAPFDYKMREDWDEGMDGEWYSLGLVDDGINEHLTDYCPNCGARMDGDDDAKPEE